MDLLTSFCRKQEEGLEVSYWNKDDSVLTDSSLGRASVGLPHGHAVLSQLPKTAEKLAGPGPCPTTFTGRGSRTGISLLQRQVLKPF